MKLSFIVPIYNTEPFILERCFESINCIEKLEYECILIDDGSKGEIGEFCADYSYNHKRFKYFRKKMVALVLQEMKVLEKQKGNIFISLIPMIQLLQMCLTNLFTVMKTQI